MGGEDLDVGTVGHTMQPLTRCVSCGHRKDTQISAVFFPVSSARTGSCAHSPAPTTSKGM